MVNSLPSASVDPLNSSNLLNGGFSQLDPVFPEQDLEKFMKQFDTVPSVSSNSSTSSSHFSSHFSDEALEKFWDQISIERAHGLSTTSLSTTDTSTTSATGTPYTDHQGVSSVGPAAAGVPAASITSIATASINTQRQPPQQPRNKRKHRRPSNDTYQQLLKKARTSQQNRSQVSQAPLHANSISSSTSTTTTTSSSSSSSSSSVGSMMYRHATEEENRPTESDYIAAGVNGNGTYDIKMANSASVWRKIQSANVKWHYNTAYAWVRHYDFPDLFLICLPLLKRELITFDIKDSIIILSRETLYKRIKLTLRTATPPSEIPYRHATEEENRPTEDDYIAAGVNREGTYKAKMANSTGAWKKIQSANVKWHNNTAYAWVRHYDHSYLYLKCRPLFERKLKSLGIEGSIIISERTTPYNYIRLRPESATPSTSSTSTSTSSQARLLLGNTTCSVAACSVTPASNITNSHTT